MKTGERGHTCISIFDCGNFFFVSFPVKVGALKFKPKFSSLLMCPKSYVLNIDYSNSMWDSFFFFFLLCSQYHISWLRCVSSCLFWQTKYSYLDVIGRTVVVLEKENVVPVHNALFQVISQPIVLWLLLTKYSLFCCYPNFPSHMTYWWIKLMQLQRMF